MWQRARAHTHKALRGVSKRHWVPYFRSSSFSFHYKSLAMHSSRSSDTFFIYIVRNEFLLQWHRSTGTLPLLRRRFLPARLGSSERVVFILIHTPLCLLHVALISVAHSDTVMWCCRRLFVLLCRPKLFISSLSRTQSNRDASLKTQMCSFVHWQRRVESLLPLLLPTQRDVKEKPFECDYPTAAHSLTHSYVNIEFFDRLLPSFGVRSGFFFLSLFVFLCASVTQMMIQRFEHKCLWPSSFHTLSV